MIIIKLDHTIYLEQRLEQAWIFSCYHVKNTQFIISSDGTVKKYNADNINSFIDKDGNLTTDPNQKFKNVWNVDYNWEFVNPDHAISRHLGFKDGEFGVILENRKEKITKAFLIPEGVISYPDPDEDDFGVRVSFSYDGLTVLVYQLFNSKILILDNPVFQ